MSLHLVIANKAYSSWSLRPWLLLVALDIPFDETVIPMDQPETRATMLRYAPTGKCPSLHDGAIHIWESLAIIEYVAETFPDRPIWPADKAARALARTLASEMHAGFQALRGHCPTNFRRPVARRALTDEAAADVARLETMWRECRDAHGAGGPFLFGRFSAADAMFAPVVNRLHVYDVPVAGQTRAYMDAIMALPAWRRWMAEAAAEPWRMAKYEFDLTRMPGPTLKPRRAARDRHFELGGRQVTSRGLEVSYLADLYHQSMTVSWPVFFAGFAVVFLTLNLGFATLYWLGTAPIANAHPGSVSDLFFFSIETLATVGYGDMHPQTVYGHLVATVEIFTGMASLAVMGGLVFSRFSRPRAALLFSNAAVIGLHQGALTLMARLANARHDLIEASSVNLWFSRLETTRENTPFRRFQKLTLERSENPLFSLSWTIFHKIDDDSPLNGVSADELTRDDIMVLVTFAGVDASSGQTVYARKRYGAADIRWNHSFVDILNYDDSGRLVFDYTGFHELRPQDGGTP